MYVYLVSKGTCTMYSQPALLVSAGLSSICNCHQQEESQGFPSCFCILKISPVLWCVYLLKQALNLVKEKQKKR